MMPICRVSPHRTPAYFLNLSGHTLKAMMNDASV
jgi:hypothetical protein